MKAILTVVALVAIGWFTLPYALETLNTDVLAKEAEAEVVSFVEEMGANPPNRLEIVSATTTKVEDAEDTYKVVVKCKKHTVLLDKSLEGGYTVVIKYNPTKIEDLNLRAGEKYPFDYFHEWDLVDRSEEKFRVSIK